MKSPSRTICFVSTARACPTNLLENAQFEEEFRRRGWVCSGQPEAAEVIVINSCGYSGPAEQRTLGTLEELQKKYPGKRIILGGCMPKINPVAVDSVFSGSTVPAGDLRALLQELGEEPYASGDEISALPFRESDLAALPWAHKVFDALAAGLLKVESSLGRRFDPLHNILLSGSANSSVFAVSAGQGCLGTCTYCGIRKAKGKVRSKPAHEVVGAIERRLKGGAKRILLTADDLGCWGQDIGTNVSELISRTLSLPYNFELVLNYISPEWLMRYRNELSPLLLHPKVVACYVPFHSGSDRILEKMGRGYTADPVLAYIAELKRQRPALAVKTNFILAFPTESWSELLQSCWSARHFDFIVSNIYSPRPGTAAAGFDGRRSSVRGLLHRAVFGLFAGERHLEVAVQSLLRGIRS